MSSALFQIRDLDVKFATPDGEVHAVKRANLTVSESRCLGVVGESGSGKSQLFLAALGLLATNGRATGSVKFNDQELMGLPQSQINQIRGSKITMIFQDPLTSLTPHMTVGDQIIEALRVHQRMPYGEALRRSIEILNLVRIPEALSRMAQYPHELSGGMRQRVMIAMATACGPDLIIADEPTTALDVTVQAQILDILRDLKAELKTAIVMISHDMGVIAGLADDVAVMRDGEIVELGSIDEVFYRSRHAYTKILLDAIPRVDQIIIDRPTGPLSKVANDGTELLRVENLRVDFPVRTPGFALRKTKQLRAVDDVSFVLREGETLGIVGESGCGKSTLARAVLKLVAPTAGTVAWCGRDLGPLAENTIRRLRNEFQIVFQDPLASLDPRMTIGESISEPLKSLRRDMTREQITQDVREMMARVGLEPAWINRYPHEISGGQNQRVGIARAMILKPKLLICDEAVSALDVSIQSQIVDLIRALQAEFGLSLIFISHDLSIVRQVSHRVMVLYLGRIVELADRDTIYRDARHPYTRALLAAVPIPDPRLERAKVRPPLPPDLPSPLDTRASLSFMKSKVIDDPDAVQYRPALIEVAPGHFVAEHDAA